MSSVEEAEDILAGATCSMKKMNIGQSRFSIFTTEVLRRKRYNETRVSILVTPDLSDGIECVRRSEKNNNPPVETLLVHDNIVKNRDEKNLSVVPGLAAIGLVITALAGIVHAFYTGSGLGLIASAASFGVFLGAAFI